MRGNKDYQFGLTTDGVLPAEQFSDIRDIHQSGNTFNYLEVSVRIKPPMTRIWLSLSTTSVLTSHELKEAVVVPPVVTSGPFELIF